MMACDDRTDAPEGVTRRNLLIGSTALAAGAAAVANVAYAQAQPQAQAPTGTPAPAPSAAKPNILVI